MKLIAVRQSNDFPYSLLEMWPFKSKPSQNPATTFKDLSAPFPLYEASVATAVEYKGAGRCSICGQEAKVCFELDIRLRGDLRLLSVRRRQRARCLGSQIAAVPNLQGDRPIPAVSKSENLN